MILKKDDFCRNCKCPLLKAEYITGDYCYGCRAILGKNWVNSKLKAINSMTDDMVIEDIQRYPWIEEVGDNLISPYSPPKGQG